MIPGQTHNNLTNPDDLLNFLANPDDLQELLDIPEMQTSGKIVFWCILFYDQLHCGFPGVVTRITHRIWIRIGSRRVHEVEFQLLDEETCERMKRVRTRIIFTKHASLKSSHIASCAVAHLPIRGVAGRVAMATRLAGLRGDFYP